MSAGSVVILLMVLVSVDENVRTQLWRRAATSPSVELAGAGDQIRNITHVIVEAARNQSLAHAPLLIFGLAATILVLFMLRT